jgi:hypothetical protein
MRYHQGSLSGNLLRLKEDILWLGNVAATQITCQAQVRLETRQAHVKLETRQARSFQNGKGDGSLTAGILLRLREDMLLPGSLVSVQVTGQPHVRLETRQAQDWKRIRLT